MPELIISDTSCIILLDKIGHLELLEKLYSTIIITPDIAREYNEPLPDWMTIRKPENSMIQKALEQPLDLGEASAISLALENPGSMLIIDDLKGRKVAKSLNIQMTGTLGILYKAKETGLVSELRPLIDRLLNTDFRISERIVFELLRKAKE